MKFIFLAANLAAFFLSSAMGISSAYGQTMQKFISGAEIAQAVTDYLGQNNIHAQPKIAAERQFIACKSELEFAPLFGNFKTIEVRCPGKGGWKIAIRSHMSSKIEPSFTTKTVKGRQNSVTAKAKGQAVIMQRSLSKGAVISAQDVKMASVAGYLPADIFTQTEDVIGRISTKKLDIGKPVRASQLEHNWLVHKDQLVELTTKIGAVEVSSQGVALENAQWGQLARFLNVSSQREVFGRVASEKKIIIGAKIY